MRIETKIELKDYIKLMYILTYRRRGMIIANIMGLLLFTFTIMYFVGIIESDEFPWMPVAFSVLIIIVMPMSVYFSAKKNYKTHSRLQEKVIYEISEETINITGESFSSEMTWNKTYKVVELKDWFLFYQNKLVANIIPKQSIGDHRYKLREIVKNQKIKNKLKNN